MARDWTTPEVWTDEKAISTLRLQAISAQLTWLYEMMFAKEGSALTIASGVITVTGNEAYFKVSGESAAADDLVTINGGTDGDIIILVYDGEAITLKDTGNIDTGDYGDLLILAATGNSVVLRYDGSNWIVQTTSVNMGIGKETIYISVAGMVSEASTEPDGLEKLDFGSICHWGVPFDPDSWEFLNFGVGLPERYDGGPVSLKFAWTTKTGGATGVVRWGGGIFSKDDGDSLGSAPSSSYVNDSWIGDGKIHKTDWLDITPEGSVSDENEFLEVRILRAGANAEDTLTVDAYLLGVWVRWTSNQETDD